MRHAAAVEELIARYVPWIDRFARKLVVRANDRHITTVRAPRAFINSDGSYDLIPDQEFPVSESIDLDSARHEFELKLKDFASHSPFRLNAGFFMPGRHQAKYFPALEMRADAGMLLTVGSYVLLSFDPLPALRTQENITYNSDWRAKYNASFSSGDTKLYFNLKEDGGLKMHSSLRIERQHIGHGHLTALLERLEY